MAARRRGRLTPVFLRCRHPARYGRNHTSRYPSHRARADRQARRRRCRPRALGPAAAVFELAAVPARWFQHLQLPVVSYALPALIAIGQVLHRRAPVVEPGDAMAARPGRSRTHRVLIEMQPEKRALPRSDAVDQLRRDEPVGAGLAAVRSWNRGWGSCRLDPRRRQLADRPNLSTWVSTLAIGALADAAALRRRSLAMRHWLIRQQSTREHPFTHAAPGAWAWTPLSGGVPDADDTAGALVALHQLGEPDGATVAAAAAGVRWLLGVQNRDGGVPTFCRGWGTLPFDRRRGIHPTPCAPGCCTPPEPRVTRLRSAVAVPPFTSRPRSERRRLVSAVVRQRRSPGRDAVYGTAGCCGARAPLRENSRRGEV